MPPKRGLSLEEKRSKLLAWFNLEHTIYNIKEIESIGSKRTGIPGMQTKDILQSLIDDGLVNVEKCGTQNIYWVFKYNTQLKLNKEFEKYSKLSDENELKIEELKNRLEILKNDRAEEVDNNGLKRSNLIVEVENLKKELESKLTDLNKSGQLTENYLKQLQLKNAELIEGCEELGDTLETIISYIANTGGHNVSALKKEFGIPEEFICV